MPDAAARGAPTGGGSSDGLVPLPKRVAASDDGPAITDPITTVEELIERAAHLVATLDHDVEGLKSDQEEERQRIEKRWEAQQTRAEQALEQLGSLRGVAQRLADRKARPDLLETGLRRTAIANFPYDDNTPFEELVEAVTNEVKMAKGITGLIRLEGIGELLAAATRSVDRLLANADATKSSLLAQTEDELTAERKEARASFEIGLQVLRRDLDLLNGAVPVSCRSWDDAAWEDRGPTEPARCLVRLGSFVHPRLRNTPIPAVIELPGGPGVLFDAGPHAERTLACIESVVLRALAATPPGGLALTIVDPNHRSDRLGALVRKLQKGPGAPIAEVATGEEAIEAALAGVLERMDRIDAELVASRTESLTECNVALGEVVEPWHLVVVLDHPTGLTDHATELLHTVAGRGPRCGVGLLVTADATPTPAFGADGKPRHRQPLPPMPTLLTAGPDVLVDRGRAGHWTVLLDGPPGEVESAEIVKVAATATARGAASRADVLTRLLRLLPAGIDGGLPDLDRAFDRDDPASWWSGTATDGIGVPVGRVSGLDAAVATFDSEAAGSLLVTGGDTDTIDALLAAIVDAGALLYPPAHLQMVLLSVRGRSVFEACIDSQLPHARLVGVDTEVAFTVAVLEGLAAELGRRGGPAAPVASLPRLLVVISGFGELLHGSDRHAVRAGELIDQLLSRGHLAGIHLVLADTTIDAGEPALPTARDVVDRCPARITLARPGGAAADGDTDAHPAAVLATAEGQVAFRPPTPDPVEHGRLLWEVRAKAHDDGVPRPPQVYDGRAPARLDRRGPERLAANAERRGERLKPRFWLGDPLSLGGPIELLLRRTDGANLLVVTNDEISGRGMLLGAITTAALNHGAAMRIVVADFLPPETGFADSVLALDHASDITVVRRRQFDKALHEVQRTVSDRHAAATFTEHPVLYVIAGLGRARDLDLDPDDPEVVERHQLLEAVLRDGPEVGVHSVVWCEAPSALSRRMSRNELREFSYRAVGPLDPDVGRGITGSDVPGTLEPHQAVLFDEDSGQATRFRPYRPLSPEWLAGLAARVAAPARAGGAAAAT